MTTERKMDMVFKPKVLRPVQKNWGKWSFLKLFKIILKTACKVITCPVESRPHLVSRFTCNTRMIVHASSSPPVSLMSNSCNKT